MQSEANCFRFSSQDELEETREIIHGFVAAINDASSEYFDSIRGRGPDTALAVLKAAPSICMHICGNIISMSIDTDTPADVVDIIARDASDIMRKMLPMLLKEYLKHQARSKMN